MASLNEDQKELIRKNFKKHPDLKTLTKIAWDEEGIDGRSLKGRLVREFLIEEGLEYKTAYIPESDDFNLTDDQKMFLLGDSIDSDMNALEIARLVFQDPNIVSLSLPHRAVQTFLKENRPEIFNSEDEETIDKWSPPKSISRVIKKIGDWCGIKLDETKMSVRDRKACEALMRNMQSVRLQSVINNYSLISDRELFESEFVRATWDKPDLTADELNLYITVCSNYIRQKHVQKRLDAINRFVQDSRSPDVHMRVTEQLKATSDELNNIEKRIESLVNKLNGDRAKRLAANAGKNVSILALVEAFQDYNERERMVRQAELEDALNEEEVERLESMDEFKARVLGITREELL